MQNGAIAREHRSCIYIYITMALSFFFRPRVDAPAPAILLPSKLSLLPPRAERKLLRGRGQISRSPGLFTGLALTYTPGVMISGPAGAFDCRLIEFERSVVMIIIRMHDKTVVMAVIIPMRCFFFFDGRLEVARFAG